MARQGENLVECGAPPGTSRDGPTRSGPGERPGWRTCPGIGAPRHQFRLGLRRLAGRTGDVLAAHHQLVGDSDADDVRGRVLAGDPGHPGPRAGVGPGPGQRGEVGGDPFPPSRFQPAASPEGAPFTYGLAVSFCAAARKARARPPTCSIRSPTVYAGQGVGPPSSSSLTGRPGQPALGRGREIQYRVGDVRGRGGAKNSSPGRLARRSQDGCRRPRAVGTW